MRCKATPCEFLQSLASAFVVVGNASGRTFFAKPMCARHAEQWEQLALGNENLVVHIYRRIKK